MVAGCPRIPAVWRRFQCARKTTAPARRERMVTGRACCRRACCRYASCTRRLLSPGCCLPAAISRLLSPGCYLPAAISRLLSPGCCLPAAISRLLSPGCYLPAAISRLLSPGCCLQAAMLPGKCCLPALSVGRLVPARVLDVVHHDPARARRAGRNARIGRDRPLAARIEILRMQPVAFGDGACELFVEFL